MTNGLFTKSEKNRKIEKKKKRRRKKKSQFFSSCEIFTLYLGSKSSCECKKVVSDILGEIKFVVDTESTCKMTHLKSWYKSQLKVFTFLWSKQDVKNNETQRKSEHKIAFPSK